MQLEKIPSALRALPQWVLWKIAQREGGKPTKLPFQTNGKLAESDSPQTWATFKDACEAHARGGYSGIGFVFSKDDPFCGIDLDGCRDDAGKVADWARDIILKLDTYAEVSPSQHGVKLFCRAAWPFSSGKKIAVNAPKVCDKDPGIEVYENRRYFAVTGDRLKGVPLEPQERQDAVSGIANVFWADTPQSREVIDWRSDAAVIERARKYVAKLPPAISGCRGHDVAFHAACVLVCGFALGEDDAIALFSEYNQRCEPLWSDKEIRHKIQQANQQPGERGYLRNAKPERWSEIRVPEYRAPAPKPEPRETTLADAARLYVDSITNGKSLIELGIGDLDYALCGGVERGEMVILAARPSHGKSAVALQCVHTWAAQRMPCCIVSEEMSALALGKRTVQYISAIPQEHWQVRAEELRSQVSDYERVTSKCLILEGCGTAEAAADAIERVVKAHGVQCVVVDYAQLLRSSGKTRYEQITNTSIVLRQLASTQKLLVMALCQISREIESRTHFVPQLSDLKDSGQLEQDADVVVFLVWPHRINESEPREKFQFFIEKNRNRGMNQRRVVARFLPDRQMILDALAESANARTRSREQSASNLWAGEGDLPP